jgi:hypothetical protein
MAGVLNHSEYNYCGNRRCCNRWWSKRITVVAILYSEGTEPNRTTEQIERNSVESFSEVLALIYIVVLGRGITLLGLHLWSGQLDWYGQS